MSRLFLLIFISHALMGSLTVLQAAPLKLVMEEFMGGTGKSAASLIKTALMKTGDFDLDEESGQAIIRGSSSAGRIDGALIATSGQVLFNNQYDYGDMRQNAWAFADDIQQAITGTAGIASTSIAFVSDVSGAREIYITSPDGKRVKQLTRDRSISLSPALGPGGRLLAHTSYAGGFADVYVTNLENGARQKIFSAQGTNSGAAFSQDGTRLALSMSYEGDPEIYTAQVNGKGLRRLTESLSVEFSPAWAPDGQRLVFCSDASGSPQLYVKARKGQGAAERLDTGYKSCTGPDWSPNGQRIAFTGSKGRSKTVAVFDLGSGTATDLLSGAEDPAWAPDARHLAAVMDGALIIIDTRTGKHEKVLTYGKISEPTWAK